MSVVMLKNKECEERKMANLRLKKLILEVVDNQLRERPACDERILQ